MLYTRGVDAIVSFFLAEMYSKFRLFPAKSRIPGKKHENRARKKSKE